jgi:hypothetical protein
MPTRIKSSQILDGSIVASDLHPAIAVNTTAAGTFGSVIVDTITIDAAAIATSGDLTLDSAGDITLNADGADIILADDTVDFGRFKRDGGDFVIKAETADKDIIFKGVKAGSPDTVITALSLDMSNDGRATFNENIVAGGTITGSSFVGVATSAQYADLAENYLADSFYNAGTVVEFGGNTEVTISSISHSTAVAGIVSTAPAYLMNSHLEGEHVVAVALTGRVPCAVQGPVKKGTVLVSGIVPGTAMAIDSLKFEPGCVIGKSMSTIETAEIKTIEVAVGRL